jgi:hypothetical protein
MKETIDFVIRGPMQARRFSTVHRGYATLLNGNGR